MLGLPALPTTIHGVLGQPVGQGVRGQVQDQAVASIRFGSQASAHHLQVERKAQRGSGDDDAGCVGQVEALGGDNNVDQDFDTAVAKSCDGLVAFSAFGVRPI